MKFAEELYRLYENDIQGNEDALLVVSAILEDYERSDILAEIKGMSDDEVMEMFMLYIYEKLRLYIADSDSGRDIAFEREHVKRLFH
ncbi:DUF6154 family protein [Bacillus alkalicellulosilyticus]|uniref:DUF6154 family protein n=1 Tax=Alkalihalobacterium alkalicellulosilyticum TaxID=1912214 RepID=UPI0009963901|nr:DUF6154 family protein [Bacillus alkalicellulosilyticus]